MNPRIGKLEALLARIMGNAAAPRVVAAPVAASAAPDPALDETQQQHIDIPVSEREPRGEREIEVPLESRARLVAAPTMEVDVEELEVEQVLELDDRHIVSTEEVTTVTTTTETKPAEAEEPPPSSRRPIAEPAETPQEAQIQVAQPEAHDKPPESGKQVASDALSFDDDFTGVREAPQQSRPTTAASAEPSIQLQSLRSPPTPVIAQDEMEVELPSTPTDATRPPPGPIPELAPPRTPEIISPTAAPPTLSAEVSRPTRPVAAAQVAEMISQQTISPPRTFGDLIDMTLSL